MEEQEQDAVICGTGLKECILSALLSKKGLKILHIDRNGYYGGEGASLNISTLYEEFQGDDKKNPETLGHNRQWNVDLIPKFILASGDLVKMLLYTTVTKQLEWQPVDFTQVVQNVKSGYFSTGGLSVNQVPGNAKEALKSKLMGLFQKKKCFNFLKWLDKVDFDDKSKHKYDLDNTILSKIFNDFGLDEMTTDFLIHAVALLPNDKALNEIALPSLKKIKIYTESHGRQGNKSPFIYPMQGLGGLPEGFSRLCAIHGGTQMLNKDIDGFKYNEVGEVVGVISGEEIAKCKFVVCDPTYAKGKIKITKKIIRSICIMNHPMESTQKADCCQVIIPQKQTGRKNDIYIINLSQKHQVCNKGFYLAIISTVVETEEPDKELEIAQKLLGDINYKFTRVYDQAESTDDGSEDKIYVTSSFNETSHFQEATIEVINIYERITGEKLDFSNMPDTLGEDEY